MKDKDLVNAIHFLQRVAVGRMDEQRLIDTVEALVIELERRKRERREHGNR
jgi:hypothetical protein